MNAIRLHAEDGPQVVNVLTDSFRDYPVMRYVLGATGQDDGRLEKLIGFFVFRRIALGGPMIGVYGPDGRLAGAAVMTLPSEPEPSGEISAARERTWAELGADCRDRHDAYGAVTKTLWNLPPHHHLNMIGIRTEFQGRGFARPLLEAVFAVAAEDPKSAGVSLTTEVPKNVQFYKRFGFEVVGQAPVTPEFQTWGFFKRSR